MPFSHRRQRLLGPRLEAGPRRRARDALEHLGHRRRGRQPSIRIARQPGQHQVVEAVGQPGHQRRRRDDRLLLDRARHRVDRVADEQRAPGQQLPQHHRGREHVGAPIDRQVLDLLGRHVRRLALERAELGHGRLTSAHQRDAEVEHLHPRVVAEHQVVGADVAVDHAEQVAVGHVAQLVRRVQPATRLGDGLAQHRRRRPQLAEPAEAHARHVLHHHVRRAVVLAEVEDLRDRRMGEPRQQPRLVEEHRAGQRRLRQLGAHGLDRAQLLEPAGPAAPREQHVAHAAGLQRVQELIVAEPRADHSSSPLAGRSRSPCLYRSSRKWRRLMPACSAAWVMLPPCWVCTAVR